MTYIPELEGPVYDLSMPREKWCPRCGIHNRCMDYYGYVTLPVCPICEDELVKAGKKWVEYPVNGDPSLFSGMDVLVTHDEGLKVA